MQPENEKMTDGKLNELLGRLKAEPVPEPALEASWRAIEGKLEWRNPTMHPLAFVQTAARGKWVAIFSAAAITFLALSVGLVYGPGSGGLRAPGLIVHNGGRSSGWGWKDERAAAEQPAYGIISDANDLTCTGSQTGGAGGGGSGREVGKEAEKLAKRLEDYKSTYRLAEPAKPPAPAAAPAESLDRGGRAKATARFGGREMDARKGQEAQLNQLLANPEPQALAEASKSLRAASGKEKPGAPPPPPPSGQSAQKIIKTAELSLEIKKFEAASREVDRLVTTNRGFYADNRVTQNEDGTTGANIVIRVPQENFERLYGELKKLGRVKSENAKGEDVTEAYTDLAARMRNAETYERTLLANLKEKEKSSKVSELLEVQREINKVREEIERMKGKLQAMDNRIDFSTIYLSLAERTRTVPVGTMSIEVKDAAEADRLLDAIVGKFGGQVAARNSVKRPDGTSQINATVKAPMTRFGELVEQVKGLGRVDREDVRGYNLAEIAEDEGAKSVLSTVSLVLFEASLQKPGGSARIEVETLEGAANVIGRLLAQVEGTQVSRQEQREGGAASATYVLRVSRGRFAELANSLGLVGTPEEKALVGADVVKVEGPAAKVPCDLTLFVHERARQLPQADATVGVKSLKAADEAINAQIKALEGQIQTRTENKKDDGTPSAEYKLVVRRARFGQLVALVDSLGGYVDHKNVTGELGDVKGAAADTLCPLALSLYERRAQVPSATLNIVVKNANEAGKKLEELCKELKAETGTPQVKEDDGAVYQVWRPRVTVEHYERFIARVRELGRVRSGSTSQVVSGVEEKPDPKALANVTVQLVQPSSAAPSEEETRGTFKGMVRAAIKSLWAVFGAIIYGLIVVIPVLLILVGLYKLVRRLTREKTPAVTVSASPDPKKE